MSKNFYHDELLPKSLSLLQAEVVLSEHFAGNVLIGVDEAGRGPVAGPVVAAATVLKANAGLPQHLNDSKKLSEKQREKIFEALPNYCEHYSIGEA
jgi:ribonuclease HII